MYKRFNVDIAVYRIESFSLSSVYSITQKCGKIFEEIKWNKIQHSCLPILLYDLDCIHLNNMQVHKLSVAYNTTVRRCFNMSRFKSVCNILYFLGSIFIDFMLDEKMVLLMKLGF